MQKVLYINNRYRRRDNGVYESLSAVSDLEVFLVSPPPAGESVADQPAAVRRAKVFGTAPETLTAKQPWRLFRFYKALSAHLRASRPAAVVCSSETWKTSVVYAAARRAGVPVILRATNWKKPLPTLRRSFTALHKLCNHYELRHADAVLYSGANSLAHCLSLGVEQDKLFKFTYLHKDLSQDAQDEVWAAKLREIALDDRTFLYFGRVAPYKGLIHLIRAFQTLHGAARLLIIGGTDGPDGIPQQKNRAYLQDCLRAASSDARIHYLGPAPSASAATIYKACSVFILANPDVIDGKASHETWANTLTEAVCMGLPVICSKNVGGARDVVRDGENGFLVEGHGTELEAQLAAQMAKFFASRELVHEFGAASRRLYTANFGVRQNSESFARALAYATGGARIGGGISLQTGEL